MLQAEARAHRIGQTQPVTVYKLITQGTVEEQMMGRIQKKLYLSAKVTESMRNIHTTAVKKRGPKVVSAAADDDMPQLDTSQLMSLVRRGAQALSHPEININEMMKWDWPTMLAMCKDKPADLQVSENLGNATVKAEDEQQWLSKMEHVESRVFQGKKWTKEKEISGYGDIQKAWAREERRVGKNTTIMVRLSLQTLTIFISDALQVDGFAISKESMRCGDWEVNKISYKLHTPVTSWAPKTYGLMIVTRTTPKYLKGCISSMPSFKFVWAASAYFVPITRW